MVQFSTGPINKAVQSFRKRLWEYTRRLVEHIFEHLLSHKYVQIYGVYAVLNAISWDSFWHQNCWVATL